MTKFIIPGTVLCSFLFPNYHKVRKSASLSVLSFRSLILIEPAMRSLAVEILSSGAQTTGLSHLNLRHPRRRIDIRKLVDQNQAVLPNPRLCLPPPSNPHLEDRPQTKRLGAKPCHSIIAFMSLVIVGSAVFAVYWTTHANAMGDAFTAASWFVAVGTLVAAVPVARHYPRCKCWKRKRVSSASEEIELGHVG